MALRPEDRYPSAQALAQDIERWLADEPVSAWREPWRVRAGRWVRRHQTAVTATAAAVLVALLVGGGGAFLLERQWAERRAEQARQEAILRQGVEAALDEVTKLEGKGRWGEARAVLDQAAGRLGEEGPQDLLARLRRDREDLELVARLEDIRLSAAAVVEDRLDQFGADRKYAAVFAETGLAREGDDPAEAGSRVRASAVSGPLVAALDHWACCAQDAGRWAWLLAVAQEADPNRWRDRARQPAVWQDPHALKELLAEEKATDQSPQLLQALGARLRVLGGDAVGMLRRAQARHPDNFWLNFELGVQLDKHDDAEAASYLRAALALRPDTSVLRYNLGVSLYRQGKLREAEAEYRAAILLDPQYARPHINLGTVLADQGRREEAEAEYRTAIRLDPKDALPHNGLGLVLQEQGKLKEAEAEYRAAIPLDPKLADPHYNLGIVLAHQGRREEAGAEFRSAIRLDPKYAGAHNNLGNVLHDQGRLEEAGAEYRSAIRLDPKGAADHYNLGKVLHEQGKWQGRRRSGAPPSASTPGSPHPTTLWASTCTARAS
jgi:serine/threonine-protein kinase